MISDEKSAEIRRLFFAEHWKVGTICEQLAVHPDAVTRVLNLQNSIAALRAKTSFVDPYKDFIAQTLEQYPRLRSTRLFFMLQQRGYQGSQRTLRRYVQSSRPKARREAFFRLETLPGEQAQVDWAHFGKVSVGSTTRLLSCFVLVLGHSRKMFARFFFDQTTDNFLLGHVEAFAALGGVPRIVLYDNLKSVVIDRVGDHIRFNPRILELCGHYHFSPRPCAPYRGNEKGKVERSIHYLRYSFFEGRTFSTLERLNQELDVWLETVANARTLAYQQRSVEATFSQEKSALLALPHHHFSAASVINVVAKKTPYVRFDRNDYSIPHTHVGVPLSLSVNQNYICIFDVTSAQIANHQRSHDAGQRIEDPAHLKALELQKRRARTLRGRSKLTDACKNADAFFEQAVLRNLPLGPLALTLLQLLERYGAVALDAQFAEANRRGAISAASIEYMLEKHRRANGLAVSVPATLSLSGKASELRTITQPLDIYDALSKPGNEQ